MAVLKDAVDLTEKGYAPMAKSTVVPFDLPSEFSPDPLTTVIQAGARELLRTAVIAEVSDFIAEYANLLDEEGRQRLVAGARNDDQDWEGAGSSAARPRSWCKRRWQQDQVHLEDCPALPAQGEIGGGVTALALPERHFDGRFQRGAGGPYWAECGRPVLFDDHTTESELVGRVSDLAQARPDGQALRLHLGGWGLLHAAPR